MIDLKYTNQKLSVLTDEEKIREVTWPKVMVSIELFQQDLDLAKSLNINMSRILRFKFHDWLHDKVTPKQD